MQLSSRSITWQQNGRGNADADQEPLMFTSHMKMECEISVALTAVWFLVPDGPV